jgi:single-stranded-DNA-specific exonuclease
LIQAFAQLNEMPFSFNLEQYLDLVAISIAADIVPITGENRILSLFSVCRQLNRDPRPGIKAILELSGMKKRVGD